MLLQKYEKLSKICVHGVKGLAWSLPQGHHKDLEYFFWQFIHIDFSWFNCGPFESTVPAPVFNRHLVSKYFIAVDNHTLIKENDPFAGIECQLQQAGELFLFQLLNERLQICEPRFKITIEFSLFR